MPRYILEIFDGIRFTTPMSSEELPAGCFPSTLIMCSFKGIACVVKKHPGHCSYPFEGISGDKIVQTNTMYDLVLDICFYLLYRLFVYECMFCTSMNHTSKDLINFIFFIQGRVAGNWGK